MVTNGQPRSMQQLVDLKHGVISRKIFVDKDIYQQEQERVFARVWLFVGHESQIPKPGDYFTSCMGEESVILTRDKAHHIHVFLNTCRHRGMKVCRYDEGNTALFTCPYHGWSFATDGRLVGVPHRESYRGQLDTSQWGLVEVAQMVNYHGAIWATWDPEAPSFRDYMGDMLVYLDEIINYRDGREGGAEILGGVQKWMMPCNWKFGAENFQGDGYHNISHRSVDLTGIGPSGKGRRDNEHIRVRRINVSFPGGPGAHPSLQLEDVPFIPTFQDAPVVEEYFKHAYEERKRRLGERARLMGHTATIFPNMSMLSRQPRSIAVWHPRGATQTEAWRWYLVDKDAPQEVKDMLRHYYMRYSGPGGMTEQDDMENWNYAAAASRGTIARRHPYNYQMAMGHENPHDVIPGITTDGYNENNQRGMYKRWAELMDAASWEELAPNK